MIRPFRIFKVYFKKVHFFDLALIFIFWGLGLSVNASAQGDLVIQQIDSTGVATKTESNTDVPESDVNERERPLVIITDWQGGAAGAASVSMDDSCPSCRDTLNNLGFKGTYYLSHTNQYTQEDWDLWRAVRQEGHEIGGHTTNHIQYVREEVVLRRELSTNMEHIMTNLDIPEHELISFAWPCGETHEKNKDIASEYYVSSRGYHINELEDKNPKDFMALKCLNTPHYHVPDYDPPDYFQKADEAEKFGKWVHFVFHNHCVDDGAIKYLAEKDLWEDTVGNIVKYIRERQNTKVTSVLKSDSEIVFSLLCDLDTKIYNTPLTLQVFTNPEDVMGILVDEHLVEYKKEKDSVLFNVKPSEKNDILIYLDKVPESVINQTKETEESKKIAQKPVLAGSNGIVANIWIEEKRLTKLKDHKIKYLVVDVGDTDENGKIETPKEQIESFIQRVKTFNENNNYNFIVLPYSEINTYHYDVTSKIFRDNYIKDYSNLIAMGFDGIYVDIEPIRLGLENEFLDLLNRLQTVLPKEALVGVYTGYISKIKDGHKRGNEWEWPLDFLEEVTGYSDFICVPSYDSQKNSELEYQSYLEAQVKTLSSKRLNSGLIYVVPTHKDKPETLENALKSFKNITPDYPYNQFIGVCIFAEWTIDDKEWETFKSYMD